MVVLLLCVVSNLQSSEYAARIERHVADDDEKKKCENRKGSNVDMHMRETDGRICGASSDQ
jgi:hypothetical protein